MDDCVEYYNIDRLHFSLDADNEMLLMVFHSRRTADETGQQDLRWMDADINSQQPKQRTAWLMDTTIRFTLAQEKYTKQARVKALSRSRKTGNVEKITGKADQVIGDVIAVGKVAAGEAGSASADITKRVGKEARKLQEQSQKTLGRGITIAKGMTNSAEHNLKILEQMGRLKDSGVLTEQEFLEQKAKILSRI